MAWMTRAQRSVSLLMLGLKMVRTAAPLIQALALSSLRTSGSLRALFVALDSLSTTGCGMPAGPRIPNQRPVA